MDSSDWFCGRCKQAFRPTDVPRLIPTDHGNQLVHPGECPPESCATCGHSRAVHSPFHAGYCVADKPYNGDFVCPCSRFVAASNPT